MTHSDANSLHNSFNSPNYKLACDLGYELTKNEYLDVYNYAKLVRNEYLKASEASPARASPHQSLNNPNLSSSYSNSYLKSKQDSNFYPEDLWIKHLREYFDSEFRG